MRPRKVPVSVGQPFEVDCTYMEDGTEVGGFCGGSSDLESALASMSAFPPDGDHAVESVVLHPGVTLHVMLKPINRPVPVPYVCERVILRVHAPTKEEAMAFVHRIHRAQFTGRPWWDFNHPDYRPHSGMGR